MVVIGCASLDGVVFVVVVVLLGVTTQVVVLELFKAAFPLTISLSILTEVSLLVFIFIGCSSVVFLGYSDMLLLLNEGFILFASSANPLLNFSMFTLPVT